MEMIQKTLANRITGNISRKIAQSRHFVEGVVQIWKKGGITKTNVGILGGNDLLAGKRILVTGGSLGIGFAIAKRYVDSGGSVVITGRTENDLKKAVTRIGSERCKWMCWDVAKVEIANEKLEGVEKILGGPVDILVNNAGILINESFPNVSESGWDKVYSVNSKGLFFITQSLVQKWLKRGPGDHVRKIINISSTSGFTPGAYPYRMTKWDVVGMTRGLALNLAPHNIIVNGLAPGRTAGRMLGIDNDNVYDREIPMKRAGLPEEIAELALFLAGDTSNYITGQTIICDGGMTLMQYE